MNIVKAVIEDTELVEKLSHDTIKAPFVSIKPYFPSILTVAIPSEKLKT